MNKTVEIGRGLYYTGIKDYDRRMFDALVSLPEGTSYNSYLIKAEKPALIDTVNPGFEKNWLARISEAVDPQDIQYVVMNHSEPDHAGAIPYFLTFNKRARLVASEQGRRLALRFYGVEESRIIVVKDGDTISLGNRRLRFVSAPMLHWPETMFAYLEDASILFTCDFFGFHTAKGLFDSDFEDIESGAKRYYGEIMLPFSSMGKKAMDKIKNLKIDLICPSHGPVYRNPQRIMTLYNKWVEGRTEEKAVFIYVSMWKNIESMVDRITDKLLANRVKFSRYNFLYSDPSNICADLVDSRAIVFGAPTVLSSMHPLGIYAANLVKMLRPPAKYAVLLSSYGWAESASRHMQDILGKLPLEVIGSKIINGPASEEDLKEVDSLTEKLMLKLKE